MCAKNYSVNYHSTVDTAMTASSVHCPNSTKTLPWGGGGGKRSSCRRTAGNRRGAARAFAFWISRGGGWKPGSGGWGLGFFKVEEGGNLGVVKVVVFVGFARTRTGLEIFWGFCFC